MAALNQQLSLRLTTPDAHGNGLHPEPRHGAVLIWQMRAPKKRWQRIQPTDDLARALLAHAGGEDRYLSVNEFTGWRLVRLLKSLRACYVDLDGCSSVDYALQVVDDLMLPAPTYAVESGRGVHLYWLIDATPAKALPVWQAIQDRLVAVLKCAEVGVDPAARDCTRVLRLVGTVNSKSGREVVGYITGHRWTLHQLADEVLGFRSPPPAQRVFAKGKVASIERRRSSSGQKVTNATGIYRLWHGRYQDLCLIGEHAAFMRAGGVPEGCRDKLLFCLSNALSWFAPADRIEEEIARVARTFTPTLGLAEAMAAMKPIVERAQESADGQMREWQGMKVDPRYRMRSETMRDWLKPLITPEVEAELRVLCHPDRLAERESERQKGRDRVSEGRYRQTQTKRQAQAEMRRQQAHRMRAEGQTQGAIAAEMGLTQQAVAKMLKRNTT